MAYVQSHRIADCCVDIGNEADVLEERVSKRAIRSLESKSHVCASETDRSFVARSGSGSVCFAGQICQYCS